jgi:hypothetical protein
VGALLDSAKSALNLESDAKLEAYFGFSRWYIGKIRAKGEAQEHFCLLLLFISRYGRKGSFDIRDKLNEIKG